MKLESSEYSESKCSNFACRIIESKNSGCKWSCRVLSTLSPNAVILLVDVTINSYGVMNDQLVGFDYCANWTLINGDGKSTIMFLMRLKC